MRLKDKVALVTGAASGIGKGIARAFAREGARIVIADLDTAGAKAAAAEMHESGQRAVGIGMDVCRESQVEAGVNDAIAAFGRIDILVSNVGLQIVGSREKLAYSDWKRALAKQLDGAILTTRAVLRQMYKQRFGNIIYVCSMHHKEASMPYVTAKHGLIALAEVVAREGAQHGVQASVIWPGSVGTPPVDAQIPEQACTLRICEPAVIEDGILTESVNAECTTTQDVAEAALVFASFGPKALTGQSRLVSHGWHMQ